eukprot:TRINITY_DN16231_c1_g1_i1.p1 TRINITY_DN16231_c1_g1~~TRINITY_DN16231_c1_g1_i1.p1  ORF type:complete len:526 (+),score=92.67 TRINITY_DN16231_c1_g1_i1:33-1610(+)
MVGTTMPDSKDRPSFQRKSAVRRVQLIAAHVSSACEPTQEASFDGWQTVDPIVAPGRGREAWANMKEVPLQQRWHLESRRKAETNDSRFWRVHGKLYDLTEFIDRHPGGKKWIELTRGTDVTQGVEAYHLDYAKVEAVLRAHYIRDVGEGEFAHGDRFTFAENGFFRTLRRRLLVRLKSQVGPDASTVEATGPTLSMRAACTAILAQFAGAHCLARNTGSWVAAAIAGCFQVGLWGVGHNFMHQSEKKCGLWRYAMDMNSAHSMDWQISHGLSHHLDTNLDTDFEQEFFLMSYKKEFREGLLAPVAPAMTGVVSLAQSFEYLSSTVKEALFSSAGDARGWSHVLPGLFPLLQLASYVRGRGSWTKGFGMFLVQNAFYQVAFSPLAAGVHHAVPRKGTDEEAMLREGVCPRSTLALIDGQEGKEEDFGAHQVAATSTHTVYPRSIPAFLRDYMSLTFFAYLNNHTLHHLFPGVDASRLADAHDLLTETAAEFGLPAKNMKTWHWTEIHNGWWRYMLRRQVRSRPKL